MASRRALLSSVDSFLNPMEERKESRSLIQPWTRCLRRPSIRSQVYPRLINLRTDRNRLPRPLKKDASQALFGKPRAACHFQIADNPSIVRNTIAIKRDLSVGRFRKSRTPNNDEKSITPDSTNGLIRPRFIGRLTNNNPEGLLKAAAYSNERNGKRLHPGECHDLPNAQFQLTRMGMNGDKLPHC